MKNRFKNRANGWHCTLFEYRLPICMRTCESGFMLTTEVLLLTSFFCYFWVQDLYITCSWTTTRPFHQILTSLSGTKVQTTVRIEPMLYRWHFYHLYEPMSECSNEVTFNLDAIVNHLRKNVKSVLLTCIR